MNPDDELYRCAPLIRAPVSLSMQLIRSQWSRSQAIISSEDLEQILSCSKFETLADHAQRMGAADAKSMEELLRALSELSDKGILVSSSSLQSRHASDSEGGRMGRQVAWFAIPTCARPAKMGRSLRSYAENAKRFGRSYAFLVSDDSRTLDYSRANRRAAREVEGQFGVTTFYMGRTERSAYTRLLSSAGDIPPGVAQFALLGPSQANETYGANRNAILLQTRGVLTLSADDDTIGSFGVVPGSVADLRIQPHSDASQIWSFPSRQRALGFASPAELDIASEHERLLGASLFRAVAASTSSFSTSLNDACSHMWASLCSGNDRIIVTSTGTAGDSGMLSTRDALQVTEEPGTRRRLASTKEYLAALRSREIVRQVQAPTISHSGALMATFIGIDNRLLLPPFFPVFRNEDGIFGQLLKLSILHGYSGQLPFVVRHEPDGKRSDPPEYCGVPFRFSEFLITCLSTWSGAPARFSPAARLRADSPRFRSPILL